MLTIHMLCDFFTYAGIQNTSGHPSGKVIWVPLACVITAVTLSVYSMSTCSWAVFSDGKSTINYGDDYYDNEVHTLGIFTFHDEMYGYGGHCSGYNWSRVNRNGFWLSAQVFGSISAICGGIVICWLFTSTCCPMQPSHKISLLALSIIASVFSGLTFLFYGNDYCSKLGCHLASGAWYQVSAIVLYLFTTVAILLVRTCKKNAGLEQPRPQIENDLETEQKPAFALADEIMQPSMKKNYSNP